MMIASQGRADIARSSEEEYGQGAFFKHTDPHCSLAMNAVWEKALDPTALRIVDVVLECLIPDEDPELLDLMAGLRSYLPRSMKPRQVGGLGPDALVLSGNPELTHRILYDINHEPALPFRSESFAAVIHLMGIAYLSYPLEIFREVARVLKPEGVFIVIYSSKREPDAAIPIWNRMDEAERVNLVSSYFEKSGAFDRITAYGTKKKYRSDESKKKHPVKAHEPLWVLYSKKLSSEPPGGTPWGALKECTSPDDPLVCPYCTSRLKRWKVPESPFEISYWYEAEYLYICFNDECPYFVRGWKWMWHQMRRNVSYRHMYNPATKTYGPIPVPTYYALKDGIEE